MKKNIILLALFVLGNIVLVKAQCYGTVHLDTAVMNNSNSFNITTTYPNELILISYDGWPGPGSGPVTVDGNPATFIKAESAGIAQGTVEIYAYSASATGTHAIICTESGYDGSYYINGAAAFYVTGSNIPLSFSNLSIRDTSIRCKTGGSITDTVTTPAPNSMIYCNVEVVDGILYSAPFSWTNATFLSSIHTGNGIDAAHAYAVAATPGRYTITASDTANPNNGCGGIMMIVVAIAPPNAVPVIVISMTPDSSYCDGTATVAVSGGLPPYTYHWSGGQTISSISGLCAGTYCCLVSDSGGGCSDSACITVTSKCANYPPRICYVTSDTNSLHNIVVWQKTGIDSNQVDSFFVYRKVANNSYAKIGQVSIHNFSEFVDTSSSPDVTSYFYKLSIADTCHDTNMSPYHESILLQSSLGIGNKINLSWNFYQGVTVNYYRILRDDSGLGNWHQLDSVPSGINAFTDTAAPINPGLRYRLSLNWNVNCSPYIPPHILAHAAGRYNLLYKPDEGYSNIIDMAHITGIQQAGLLALSVNVYPNPTNNMLNITINGIQTQADFYLTDVLGRIVFSDKQKAISDGYKEIVNVTALPPGVYFLSVEANGQRLVRKVIKF